MRIYTLDTSFELRDGETLLEGLLRTGHQIDYQCQSGFCGTCRVKFTTGLVDYPEPPLAFVGFDEVLPCCCRVLEPLTVDVELQPADDRESLSFTATAATRT
ncbi:class I ribonucleotide reductase maintenance protein YfaE [Aquilutibacter rugosus]|uniref:class I ribonucleotide reductase maintenance protein YfaE n=1 Tax=Aquilutibacter rugosus TaxID=3115820 RepID=UPI002F40969D